MDQGAREVKTATLYLKPFCAFHPDYYETETNCWVVFPWEIKETVREILNAHKTDLVRTEKEIAELVEAGVSKKLISQFLKEFSELKTC